MNCENNSVGSHEKYKFKSYRDEAWAEKAKINDTINNDYDFSPQTKEQSGRKLTNQQCVKIKAIICDLCWDIQMCNTTNEERRQ